MNERENRRNKYQKALNRLHNDMEFRWTNSKDNEANMLDIETLQELVDRATPKKPTESFINSMFPTIKYYCPICQEEVFETHHGQKKPNFCRKCGQALDWSATDE